MRYWRLSLLVIAAHVSSGAENANSLIRRLSHSQYNNTVKDLLGDETRPADGFPQEDYVNGFKNQSSAQDIPPLLAEAYDARPPSLPAAPFSERRKQHVSSHAVRAPRAMRNVRLPSHAHLAPKHSAAHSLRRRPSATLTCFFAKPKGPAGSNSGRNSWWKRCCNPRNSCFVWNEVRSHRRLVLKQRAGLSYFLWDTMPDGELFRSAAAGELSTPEGLDKAIRRMIADPKARQSLDQFAEQWLRFDLALNAVRDRAQYPQFTPELAIAMTEETRRLIHHLVWDDQDFMQIFTGRVHVPEQRTRISLQPQATRG